MPFCLYLAASCFKLFISSSQLLQAVYIQQLAASSCLYLELGTFDFFRVRPILFVFIFNCSKKKRFRSFLNLLFIFHLFRSFPHLKIVSPVKPFVQKIVWSVKKRSFCQKFVLKKCSLSKKTIILQNFGKKWLIFIFLNDASILFIHRSLFSEKFRSFSKLCSLKKQCPSLLISGYIWLYLLISAYI